MTFPSNAPNSHHLFSWWQILVFGIVLLSTVYYLFPYPVFLSAIQQEGRSDELDRTYLRNLIASYPNDISLKISLARQELAQGNLQEAETLIQPYLSLAPTNKIQWQALWVHYQIFRIQTYALPPKSALRQQNEKTLKILTSLFLTSPYLSLTAIRILAQEALAQDDPQTATLFYKKLAYLPEPKTIEDFDNAGKVALFARDYKDSAQFYILAMNNSAHFTEKKAYFFKAVNSMNAQGSAAQALAFADKNSEGLEKDKDMLIFLAKLALSANHTEQAATYIKQVIHLNYRDKP